MPRLPGRAEFENRFLAAMGDEDQRRQVLQDAVSARTDIWERMKAIHRTAMTEGRGLQPSEIRDWDGFERSLTDLADFIQETRTKMSVVHIDQDMHNDNGGSTATDDDDYSKAYRTWLQHGTDALEGDERRSLQTGFATAAESELRAAGVASGVAGGYAVPPLFRGKIIEALKVYGGVRSLAQIETTETGAPLPWPTVDDTANMGAILAENTQVAELDIAFGQAQLGAYMYTSKEVRVSIQYLTDVSALAAESFLAKTLSTRIARIQNQHFTTGTGVSMPQGVVTGASVGKVGTSPTAVTYNDLIDLVHSVDPAYRQDGQCSFMLNDATLAAIRKLMDGQNRPLLEPDVRNGLPNTLLGYPVQVNNATPAMAADAKSILFGNFSAGYVIRDVGTMQTLRMSERYGDFLQVAFLLFLRSDALVQDAAAIKAFKNAAS